MPQTRAKLVEIRLEEALPAGHIQCPPELVPGAGQYLLAHVPASNAPLPAPVFKAGLAPGGFLTAPPLPAGWRPGNPLFLHGPLGRGFSLPSSTRRVALAALGESSARLKPLLIAALGQGAAVVLVSKTHQDNLPPEVETQPESALEDTARWADYLAIDVARDELSRLADLRGLERNFQAQVLVGTPLPCGSMGACGACAVRMRRGWKTACKDGPVFSLWELAF
jgi:dihydroorotate dehydrogenase electron transfer subunit